MYCGLSSNVRRGAAVLSKAQHAHVARAHNQQLSTVWGPAQLEWSIDQARYLARQV